MSEVEEVIEVEKKMKEEKEERLGEVRSKKELAKEESAQEEDTRSDLLTLLIRFKLWWTGIISGTVREIDVSTNFPTKGKLVVDTPLGEKEVWVAHPGKYSSKNDLARQLALKGKEETEYSELYGEKVRITRTRRLKGETKWVLYQPHELDIIRKITFWVDRFKRYLCGFPITFSDDENRITKRPSVFTSLQSAGLCLFLVVLLAVGLHPIMVFICPVLRVASVLSLKMVSKVSEYDEKDTLVGS